VTGVTCNLDTAQNAEHCFRNGEPCHVLFYYVPLDNQQISLFCVSDRLSVW